jgi:hypothetical protein
MAFVLVARVLLATIFIVNQMPLVLPISHYPVIRVIQRVMTERVTKQSTAPTKTI